MHDVARIYAQGRSEAGSRRQSRQTGRGRGALPPQIFFISSSVNDASFIGTGAVELAGARARQISVSGGTGAEHKLIGAVVAVATARPTTIIIPSPRVH